MHEPRVVLGFIVFVAFLAASLGVAGILFVLFGPVPVKRKVTIVSRIQPPLMPLAATPISLEPPMPVMAAAPAPMPTAAAPLQSPVALPLPPAARPPVAPPPVPTKATAVEPPIAPLVLRRPRTGHTPPPAPRQRIARGTEPRPRQVFDSVELTARDAKRPRNFDTLEVTSREAPAFEVDEMTHVDDAARN